MMAPRRVFVSCGTDHHPFDRLIDWVDAAAERWRSEGYAQRLGELELHVQHGTSRAPRHGKAVAFLTGDEIGQAYSAATAVIVSCGPGAVMDARGAGRRPIVVARVRGEAVDDHQAAFALHLDHHGVAVAATTPDSLFERLVADLENPEQAITVGVSAATPTGIAGVAAAIDRLVWST